MAQRVFVKVMGFTDVERHALNTVFRLSKQGSTTYSLWMPNAPEAPQLALVDGQSYEARLELECPGDMAAKLIWVGAVAPARAWRVFERPLSWPDVVRAMDELFEPAQALDLDLDFDTGENDTGEDDTRPPEQAPCKRALIASASRDERLYLRARLALAGLALADEAETGARALELARVHHYAVALVDFSLPDVNGWEFLRQLKQAQPPIEHLIFTKSQASLGERLRARFGGAQAFLDKPPHPGKLQELLEQV